MTDDFTGREWEAITQSGYMSIKLRKPQIVKGKDGYYRLKRPAVLVTVRSQKGEASILLSQEQAASLMVYLTHVCKLMAEAVRKGLQKVDEKNREVAAKRAAEAKKPKEVKTAGEVAETYDLTV